MNRMRLSSRSEGSVRVYNLLLSRASKEGIVSHTYHVQHDWVADGIKLVVSFQRIRPFACH